MFFLSLQIYCKKHVKVGVHFSCFMTIGSHFIIFNMTLFKKFVTSQFLARRVSTNTQIQIALSVDKKRIWIRILNRKPWLSRWGIWSHVGSGWLVTEVCASYESTPTDIWVNCKSWILTLNQASIQIINNGKIKIAPSIEKGRFLIRILVERHVFQWEIGLSCNIEHVEYQCYETGDKTWLSVLASILEIIDIKYLQSSETLGCTALNTL